jgi:hypothetical protein
MNLHPQNSPTSGKKDDSQDKEFLEESKQFKFGGRTVIIFF